ncbi:hypothetical protein INT46_001464 [Mucor plumbeus]|uniref:C2H2-type domain-containing protein n=1 Tax=Mucor plumbeus TaxID=97098 RepID=A0A8H7RSV1_9FUNG|nr:hypothetical protein INT46_001464 [Mucor plumbeus]
MKQKKRCMEDVDASSDIPTTLYIKSIAGEPTIKLEPDISDTLFEYLVKENKECTFYRDESVKKRKRAENDDDDANNITADSDMLFNDDFFIDMKEEDAIKPEILMRDCLSIKEDDQLTSNVDISNRGPYYCCGCNMHIKSFVVYTEHIKTKHPKKRIKHFNLKPDFHDPDMCCKSCERTYKTKGLYHLHLKSTHQINAPGREPEIVIATQDSNENSFYCSGCNKHIEDHTSYMRHIKATHSKKHIKHFNLKPDFYDPNKYCKSCERTYKSKTLYRLHLKKTHLIDAPFTLKAMLHI